MRCLVADPVFGGEIKDVRGHENCVCGEKKSRERAPKPAAVDDLAANCFSRAKKQVWF